MFKQTKKYFAKTAASNKEYIKDLVNAEGISETTKTIKELVDDTINPFNTEPQHTETFKEAVNRLDIDKYQLMTTYKNISTGFYIFLVFSCLCFLSAMYFLFIKTNLISGLSSIAIMVLMVTSSFKYSFRAFQIRHQKLCSIGDWWNRPEEWFPLINLEKINFNLNPEFKAQREQQEQIRLGNKKLLK